MLSWRFSNKFKACDGTPSTPGPRPSRVRDAVGRNPLSGDRCTFHGATRPGGTAAPEQGWAVLDGARRPQGAVAGRRISNLTSNSGHRVAQHSTQLVLAGTLRFIVCTTIRA